MCHAQVMCTDDVMYHDNVMCYDDVMCHVQVILGGYEEINEALDDRTDSPTINLIRFGSRTCAEISFFGRGLQPRHAQVTSVERK